MALLDKHKPRPGKLDDVGFEWHYLRSLTPRPLEVWQGHQAGVLTADISPDEQWIASGDSGGAVLIWDPATGRQVRSLPLGDQEVTTVKFSPDGKWLATSGVDRVIHIWNTGSWTEARQLRKHEHTVCAVAWSPDSKQLASGGREGNVHLWETSTWTRLRTLRNNVDVVRCVAWSPDGRHLVSGNGHAGGVNVWDAATWQLKATYLAAGWGAHAIAFSDDGQWLAFGGYGGLLTVANLDEPMPEISRETVDQIWSLAFLAGDRFAVGMGQGLVEVVRLNRDRRALESEWVVTLDGKGTHRAILPLSGQQRVVLASEEDYALKLMSGAALCGCHVEPLDGTPLGTVAGDLLYVDREQRVVVRDGLYGATKTKLGRSAWRFCPSVRSAATGLVAVGEIYPRKQVQIRLFDSADWQLRQAFRPNSVPVHMSFSKDGRFLIGAAVDGKVWLYDVVTDKLRELSELTCMWHAAVDFSPTQDLLAFGACGQRTVKLFSVPAFAEITAVETQSSIKSLAFHPDGGRVAVGEVGSISIREVPSLRPIQVLRGHPGEVFAMAFSPDGRTLASAGLDGIRLWDAKGREFFAIGSVPPGSEARWLQFVDSTTLLAGNGSTENFYQYGEPLDDGRR
jgi:WD40 repeat protein